MIEVGIDVPNATADPDRKCQPVWSGPTASIPRTRRAWSVSIVLSAVGREHVARSQRTSSGDGKHHQDGFKLAEIDWKLRGAGDLLGLRQSGVGQFQLAEVINPRQVELAQREARTVYAENPALQQPEHDLLARRIRAQHAARQADIS